MKAIIYLLLLLPLCFFSQQEEDYLITHIHTLQHKTINWIKAEAKISQAEKIKLLTPLYNDKAESYCKGETIKTVEDFLKNFETVFHFTDLDNDNDIDLVFSGIECAGLDAGITNVYVNDNAVLKKIISSPGKIVELNKNKSLIIHNYPCCGMTANAFSYFSISKNSAKLTSTVSFHIYAAANATLLQLPKKLKKEKTVTLNTSTEVRFAAQEIIFENAEPVKTLVIAKTKDAAAAAVYSSYTDKAKQKWLFVKINPNDLLQENNRVCTNLLGWIKVPK